MEKEIAKNAARKFCAPPTVVDEWNYNQQTTRAEQKLKVNISANMASYRDEMREEQLEREAVRS